MRRTREEWRRLLDEQAGSGLTQTAFCRVNRLSLARFQHWKREAPPAAPWVELGALTASTEAGWDIELQLGSDIYLRLRRC
jgi:hypothetical protein